jgi:hypothetical protein
MARIEIERMALEVPGIAPEQGRRLAELVAHGLAVHQWPAGEEKTTDSMAVSITAHAGLSTEQLAQMIIKELLRQLM